MERVTKKQMYSLLEDLNRIKKMDGAVFAFDWAYGGVRLVKRYNETGGESDLSNRGTTREIYNIMLGIRAFYNA